MLFGISALERPSGSQGTHRLSVKLSSSTSAVPAFSLPEVAESGSGRFWVEWVQANELILPDS